MVDAELEVEQTTARRPGRAWAIWAAAAAFGTYSSMYAFRKPFTAAMYSGGMVWGIGEKTALVTAQVLGYSLSKVIGIRVVAEMTPARRAAAILVLILLAELALILFAVAPSPLHVVCLFLNGLPLGMVFGMVLGFLEGRRLTEALTAGLCASFIVADGVTKSVGTWLLQNGVTERWMPALAGLMFIPLLLACVWMLTRIPPPDVEDVASAVNGNRWIDVSGRHWFAIMPPGLPRSWASTCWSPSRAASGLTLPRSSGAC